MSRDATTNATLILVGLAALVGACAHAPWEQPGSDWTTVQTSHFVVHTDTPARTSRRILERFETAHGVLASVFFPGVQTRQVEALVLNDPNEYAELMGRSDGAFVQGIGTNGRILVAKVTDDDHLDAVLAHELAHEMVDRVFPNLPAWLDEGLATFLQTLQVEDGRLELGGFPDVGVLHYAFLETVSLETLFRASPSVLYGPRGGAYYATAWGLVHYLLSRRGSTASFGRWLTLVNQGGKGADAVRAAMAAAYPEATVDELQSAADRYVRQQVRQGSERVFVISYAAAPTPGVQITPGRTDRVRDLCMALRQRMAKIPGGNDLAAKDGPTRTTTRPTFMHVDLQARPEGAAFGGTLGRNLWPRLALELSASARGDEIRAGLRMRYQHVRGSDNAVFATFALGPIVGTGAPERVRSLLEDKHTVPSRWDAGFGTQLGIEMRDDIGLVLIGGLGLQTWLVENWPSDVFVTFGIGWSL